jgi:hypothetical protein
MYGFGQPYVYIDLVNLEKVMLEDSSAGDTTCK